MTLYDLACDRHSYWKFSQSQKGCSYEKCYANYEKGKYTYAEDPDKSLSFVNETTIARCYMYGDTLTRINTNIFSSKFRKIMHLNVNFTKNGLGEYECIQLLTQKNYSLRHKNTIKLLIKIIPDNERQMLEATWYVEKSGYTFEKRLRDIYGFTDSADLIRDLYPLIKAKKSREEIFKFINSYKNF